MKIENQTIHNMGAQYNAETINMGAVHNTANLATELEKLKGELAKAREAGAISEATETDASYHITKAAQLAKTPEPDKASLLDYLSKATDCLSGIEKVGGIVAALVQASGLVQRIF